MSRWGSVTWGAVLGMALWSSCSCEHDLITETAASLKVGNVVCADGAVLSYEQFQKTNKEAVGVVYEVEAKQKDAVIGYSSIEDLEKEPNKRNPFNGWKVKIEFTGRHEDGEAYKAEGWFILDKEAQVVLKHFEIPVL